jgi:phospholipid/cholesterol/gamma-HCH transport system substrate-binding protein
LIGLFTVAVVTVALAFALWMGARSEGLQEVYDVLFDETVSGLSKGSAVEFKGIRVGVVDDLRINPADSRLIRARIRVDANAPIYADTRARLNTAAITGLSTIRLSDGSGPPRHPKSGEILVIPTEPSALSKLLNSSEDVIVNANTLLVHAQALLSEHNLASINRSLTNLEQITGALAAEREGVRSALNQLASASAQANAVLAEATRLAHNANSLLDGQGKSAFDSAQRSMAALEHTMQSLDKLLADNRTPLNTGLTALADLAPAVSELRATLASLRAISRRLEERPADYLLGLEPTREFKP